MTPESFQYHTQQTLEWDVLLEALATQAHSLSGANSCRQLRLETSLEDAISRQQETTEMRSILESSLPFPTLNFEDLRESFDRASKGAHLEGL